MKPLQQILENPFLRKIYTNAGILLSGNSLAYVISFLYIAILTRAISIESFGVYSLVTGFIALVDRLTSFQTWQALIHFGTKAKQKNDDKNLFSTMLVGFCLDIMTGCVGILIVYLAAIFIPKFFGLEGLPLEIIMIAGFTLAFNWFSSCTAFLRIYNFFAIQAYYQIITSIITLILFGVLFLEKQSELEYYIIAWAAANILGRFYLLFVTIQKLHQQNLIKRENVCLKHLLQENIGFRSFIFVTNIDGIIRVVRDLDMFIINAILGPVAVGYYKIARMLTKFVGKIIDPVFQSIYPELMHLSATQDHKTLNRILKDSSIILGSLISFIVIGFAIFGKFFLATVFGADYEHAYAISLLCLLSSVVWSFAQPLSPAMISIGKVRTNMIIHLCSTLLYISLLFGLTHYFGLVGSGFAILLFFIAWSLIMLYFFRRARHA